MANVLDSTAFRFAMELLTPGGKRLDTVALERADFDRAIEATCFDALRRGEVSEYAFAKDQARIVPRFPGDGPRSAGFDIAIDTCSGERRRHFSLDYFRTTMRRHGAGLAVAGRLAPDATVAFRLAAFAEEPLRKKSGWVMDLEEEPSRITIRKGDLRAHGPSEAWDAPTADDFRVLIPRHVIDESIAEARALPDREIGGALLGHLRRDAASGELYLEVTCLVPCEQTRATAVSVTFTHDTWARVREVLTCRGEDELIVGWVHSHPFRVCAECPSPVPTECQAKVLFYSTDDEFLMESTFPRPFMVGLLAAVEPRLESALGHAPVKLFGWRDGVVVPRGFEVIDFGERGA